MSLFHTSIVLAIGKYKGTVRHLASNIEEEEHGQQEYKCVVMFGEQLLP